MLYNTGKKGKRFYSVSNLRVDFVKTPVIQNFRGPHSLYERQLNWVVIR